MRLTKQCTNLNEDELTTANALGKNVLLVCNACVVDKLIGESESKSERNHEMQKLEKEMAHPKNSVSEIKTFITQDKLADPSNIMITHSAIRTTPANQNLDRIRIIGFPESKNDDARSCQKNDFNEVQKVLEHINVEAAIRDATRLRKYDTNKAKTVLLEIPNSYQRQMILLSACKLQSSGRPVFLSCHLFKEEAERKNMALIRRRELLQRDANPRSLRVSDGVLLYIRDGYKWTPDGENSNKSGTGTT